MKKRQLQRSLLLTVLGLLLFASSGLALEYQYKFVISNMDDRKTAGKIYSLVNSVKGVVEVDIDFSRQVLFFSFDDDYTSEEKIRALLEKKKYQIEKVMLLEEPKEGVMN